MGEIDFEAEARAWVNWYRSHSVPPLPEHLAIEYERIDARARDEVRLEHEKGDPPRGSRLWRCELELNNARAEIEATRSEGKADGYRRGVEAAIALAAPFCPGSTPDRIRATLLPPEPAKAK